MCGFIYWYKSTSGLGDRIHHVVQLMEAAENQQVRFVVDLRDGMFGKLGEDVFSYWFHAEHPCLIQHPDFESLLAQHLGKLVPPRPDWFAPISSSIMHWRHTFFWQRWFFASMDSRKMGKRRAWARRQFRRLIPTVDVQAVDTRKRVCSTGPFIRPERHPGCIHLYDDWIRKPKWSAERMVWPAKWITEEIEAAWDSLSFDPDQAVGIHIRQTDKTQSNWWKGWLDDLVSQVHFAERTFVFLATDSKRVYEAFQHAPMNQQLICNPWLEFPDEEKPLHSSNFDGEWVLRTALFDMWTLARCHDFVPSLHSSFSRVVSAWRTFPPHY
jgi:hypothetical protein